MLLHKDLEKLYSIKFYFYTLEDYILYTYEYTYNIHTHTNHSTTLTTFKNIGIKCKRSNVFSLVIEVLEKHNKVIIDVMEPMNLM